jgi:hypothetical protein
MMLALAFGSAVCMTTGLVMSLAVLLLADSSHPEIPVLIRTVPWGLVLTTAAGFALLGELKQLAWRRRAQAALLVVMVAMAAWFVPAG